MNTNLYFHIQNIFSEILQAHFQIDMQIKLTVVL